MKEVVLEEDVECGCQCAGISPNHCKGHFDEVCILLWCFCTCKLLFLYFALVLLYLQVVNLYLYSYLIYTCGILECDCKCAGISPNYCKGYFDEVCIHITFWSRIMYLSECIFVFALMVYWSVIAFLLTSLRACIAKDSLMGWRQCILGWMLQSLSNIFFVFGRRNGPSCKV